MMSCKKPTTKPLQPFWANKKNLARRWLLRKSHKKQQSFPQEVNHAKNPPTFHELLVFNRYPYFMVNDMIPTWLGSVASHFFPLNNQGIARPFFHGSIFVKPRHLATANHPKHLAAMKASIWTRRTKLEGISFFSAAGDLRPGDRKWSPFLGKMRGFFWWKKTGRKDVAWWFRCFVKQNGICIKENCHLLFFGWKGWTLQQVFQLPEVHTFIGLNALPPAPFLPSLEIFAPKELRRAKKHQILSRQQKPKHHPSKGPNSAKGIFSASKFPEKQIFKFGLG